MGDLMVGCVVWGERGSREEFPVTVAPVEKLGGRGDMARSLEVVVPMLGSALATGGGRIEEWREVDGSQMWVI